MHPNILLIDDIHAEISPDPICRNCRFWNDFGGEYRHGYCDNDKVMEMLMSVTTPTPRDDFGCILFEVKHEQATASTDS